MGLKAQEEGYAELAHDPAQRFPGDYKDISEGKKKIRKDSIIEKHSNTISKTINTVPCNDMQELWSEDCLL